MHQFGGSFKKETVLSVSSFFLGLCKAASKGVLCKNEHAQKIPEERRRLSI